MLFVLAWVVQVVCLRGWCANVGGTGGVLACVVWVTCLREWPAIVGGVGDILTSLAY